MQILSLYYTDKPGGFCKRLYRLLNALVDRGHQVTYLALDLPPAKLDKNVVFQKIPFPLKARSGFIFWFVFTLWAPAYLGYQSLKLKTQRIAIFGAYYSFIAIPAKLISRAQLILFIRSLVFKINRITKKPAMLSLFSDILERLGMRAANKVVVMSKTMADELTLFVGKNLDFEVLANDVTPLPTELPVENVLVKKLSTEGKVVVLISGVFDQRKNLQSIVDVFIQLNRSNPEHKLQLIVAGEGPLLAQAKKTVADADINSVSFLGWVDSLYTIYPNTALVVHPSLHEGMPNSVLEAWGFEIPTLVAKTPELTEMVPEEELWIDQSPEKLIQKLLRFESDLVYRQLLKQAAVRCKKKLTFDWDQRAAQLVTAPPPLTDN